METTSISMDEDMAIEVRIAASHIPSTTQPSRYSYLVSLVFYEARTLVKCISNYGIHYELSEAINAGVLLAREKGVRVVVDIPKDTGDR